MIRRLSIRRKLIVVSMLTATVALGLAMVTTIVFDLVTFRVRLAQEATSETQIVARNVASAVVFDDRAAALETLGALLVVPTVTHAQVRKADGSMLAEVRRGDAAHDPSWLPPADGSGTEFTAEALFAFERIVVDGERVGSLLVVYDLSELRRRAIQLGSLLLLVLVVSLVIATVVATVLQKTISEPISHLVETARRVTREKDYAIRAERTTDDELGLLVDDFNVMLARIERRDDDLRQARDELEDRVEERTEELRSSRDELERANRELQEFMWIAAHDLQEPLRKVQAFGDRLAEKFGSVLQDKGTLYVERMQLAAGRMQLLLDDLRTFSMVTTGEMVRQPVDLRALGEQVIGELASRLEATGGSVELGDLPTIEAEPMQMAQLLRQLVDNGLKYHRPDLPPQVRIGAVVTEEERGPVCEIVVEDDGIGFEEKYLDRIFVVFQRLHGREAYDGTGVGLALCRKICERHGGTITASSRPGEGATFRARIPTPRVPSEVPATAGDGGTP